MGAISEVQTVVLSRSSVAIAKLGLTRLIYTADVCSWVLLIPDNGQPAVQGLCVPPSPHDWLVYCR